jgi:hypothetical protein
MVFLSHELQPGLPVLATTTRYAARPAQHESRRCGAIAEQVFNHRRDADAGG